MRQPHPDAVARLDTWVDAGGQLCIFPIHDPNWPVNGDGWRVEIHWPNGNVVGCSMPTYAEAIELFTGVAAPASED